MKLRGDGRAREKGRRAERGSKWHRKERRRRIKHSSHAKDDSPNKYPQTMIQIHSSVHLLFPSSGHPFPPVYILFLSFFVNTSLRPYVCLLSAYIQSLAPSTIFFCSEPQSPGCLSLCDKAKRAAVLTKSYTWMINASWVLPWPR